MEVDDSNPISGLQVGFEIDDGLYEVHSLTKGRGGVKKLLNLPNVGFGIALYMMAMTGVLLLISELIFDARCITFQTFTNGDFGFNSDFDLPLGIT